MGTGASSTYLTLLGLQPGSFWAHWGANAGGGADDDCSASFRDATLRAFLRGEGETGPDRGGDDLSCVMSCSTACDATMFWDMVLLGGELIDLVGELLYGVPYNGEIACHFEPHQLRRNCGRGERWCGLSDRR